MPDDEHADDHADENADDPPRRPLLDPRLAGAGGLLITAAALAFLLTHAGHHDPAPVPTTSVPAATAGR